MLTKVLLLVPHLQGYLDLLQVPDGLLLTGPLNEEKLSKIRNLSLSYDFLAKLFIFTD